MPDLEVSDWSGEGSFVIPKDDEMRKDSVWISSEDFVCLRGNTEFLPAMEYQQLLENLKTKDALTILHKQDNFVIEWNEVVNDKWCRIRRYKEKIMDSKEKTSVVYEESLAQLVPKTPTSGSTGSETSFSLPLISTWAVQQSIQAAKADAWVRVVGVWKYDHKTFGMVQEYDGAGFIVVFQGAELQYQFFLGVLLAFSDAYWRETHDMWINTRYKFFRHRYATWQVDKVEDVDPKAEPMYQNIKEAMTRIGYSQVSAKLIEQLQRISSGFASGNGNTLIVQSKENIGAISDVTAS